MEDINGRQYFAEGRAELIAEHLGPDVDPDSVSLLDIAGLPEPKLLPLADPPRWPKPVRADREEVYARTERFLKMPEVEFPAEEEAAA